MNDEYLRGKIYFVDFGTGIGSEQQGLRPAVIVQNNIGNRNSPTIIMAPITSSKTKPLLPTHCTLSAGNGLDMPSIILLEQLRTVDKRRILNYVGTICDEDLAAIDAALAVSVGLSLKRED